jgi:hypothetical protein
MKPGYTHTGFRPFTGHIHAARLYGHADYRGKRHALNGPSRPYEGARYIAICGASVVCGDDGELTVQSVEKLPTAVITCKRCAKLLAKG